MSRISARFAELAQAGDGALVVFAEAGHPTVESFLPSLLAVADGGADVIELGVPFSDPLADGPVIQAASQQALQQGVTPQQVLDFVAAFRAQRATPVVLMTCYNPIYQYGVAGFAQASAAAGVDGVIVTDLPPEEAGEWIAAARTSGLDTIFLLAPSSTSERVKMVAGVATGFVYCVSRMGVTGARSELPADLQQLVGSIRAHTAQPIAVGFGISQPEHVREVCRLADGAVVGSALVSLMDRAEGAPGARARAVGEFVGQLKQATYGVRPRPA
jgi:tryptophan synthase alpha chain